MTELIIKTNFWGALFGNVKFIQLDKHILTVVTKKNEHIDYKLNLISSFPKLESFFLGAEIEFQHNKNKLLLSYLPRKSAKYLYTILEKKAASNIEEEAKKGIALFDDIAKNQYLRDSNIDNLDNKLSWLVALYKNDSVKFCNRISNSIVMKVAEISNLYPINIYAEEIRKQYETTTLKNKINFFDVVESNPLTDQQRLAVVRNNDINMVLAAAGTGKTSVMVAKTLDLIHSGVVNSDEILILAYNRAAAKELAERLNQRTDYANLQIDPKPSISTFHALGRKIIKDCGYHAYLTPFVEDSIKLEKWLSEWIIDYIEENSHNLFRFIKLAYQPVNPLGFCTKEEYDAYIRDNEYRTLQGERVRGYQELLIANWLFSKGIPYKYEAQYVSKCRIETGFDYRPDFYLGNEIYLEHFGIDRQGKTRPDIDATRYNEHIIKKRELHNKHGTILLETYHYDWIEGQLENKLKELVQEQGIELNPKKSDEIFVALTESKIFIENIKRYLRCLQAIRAESLDKSQILARLKSGSIVYAEDYTEFLIKIHDAYVKLLRDSNEIDFDDMILKAIQLIRSEKFIPKWKHILVDEFQDISMARLELIKEIYKNGPNPILTVVGDDWQAIYRFSGGKLEATTRFNEVVGQHTLSMLEKTYRYNNSIADTAGLFIMQNPEQYKKNVVTHTNTSTSCVHLHDSHILRNTDKYDIEKGNLDTSQKAFQLIKEIRTKDIKGTIAILARYRYLLNDAKDVVKDDNVKFWTFHSSKGLEADYCILLGFFQGKTGFPNQNKEDAVVEALLPMLDSYPHSEERRLFYVALTRAKKESYIIADAETPSEFIEELMSPRYNIDIISERFKSMYRAIFKCPACTTGYFVLRNGKFGDFYSCTSGEICRAKPRICEQCGSPSIDYECKNACQNPNCHYEFPICDKCGRPMKLRKSRFGKFWGCSGYGLKDDSCSNKRKC